MVALPGLALHCGGFVGNGEQGEEADAAGSAQDALPERGTNASDTSAGDAALDAGSDGGDWVRVLAPQPATDGGADAAPPAVFARSLVKFGGTEGQLVFSGTLRGALGTGKGNVADGLDTLLVYLNPAGETQRVEVDSKPGPQIGDSILTTDAQGLFALSLVGADKQTNARFAKGVGSFGAPQVLGDTRDSGFIARGQGDRVLYAGNKDNGDLLIGNITDTAVATEKIGNVLISAAGRFGADFVLAGAGELSMAALPTCYALPSQLKHMVFGLEAAGLLLDKPETRCSFRGLVTGAAVSIDAVAEIPAVPNGDAGDNGFLLVAGRAKGAFYYFLGDLPLLDSDGRPFAFGYQTFDAGPNGALFLLTLDRSGAFLGMRLLPRNFNDAESYVRALTGRADGSIVMAGSLNAPVNFGGGALAYAGGGDGFVATLNHDLSHRWSTSFGDGNNQSVNAVAPGDKDTLYIAGVANGALGLRGAVIPPGVQSAYVAKITAP